jgi:hypothetical protein
MTAHLPAPRDDHGMEQSKLGWYRCKYAHPADGTRVQLRTTTPEGEYLLDGVYEEGEFRSEKTTLALPEDILAVFWFRVREGD